MTCRTDELHVNGLWLHALDLAINALLSIKNKAYDPTWEFKDTEAKIKIAEFRLLRNILLNKYPELE